MIAIKNGQVLVQEGEGKAVPWDLARVKSVNEESGYFVVMTLRGPLELTVFLEPQVQPITEGAVNYLTAMPIDPREKRTPVSDELVCVSSKKSATAASWFFPPAEIVREVKA